MSLPVVDRDEVLVALDDAASRFTRQLRGVSDPTRTAVGHWDVGQLAAHVSQIFAMYPPLVRGEGSPITDHLAMGAYWNKRLEEDQERDLGVLADAIDRSKEEFVDAVRTADWSREVAWHGGIQVPMWSLPPILLNESEIHGLDVASAEGRDWGIPATHARLIIAGHIPFLPAFVNEETTTGLQADYALHIRGDGTYFMTVSDGSITIDDRERKVDCHVSADPVDYLLVGYGRKSQWGPLLTGKIVAWGRKPWLGLKFARLFHSV